MPIPTLNEVTLSSSDYLSEKDYDKKKVGIISKIVNSPIELRYEPKTNYAMQTSEGYLVTKASPKCRGIDGNTAINHELAHVLFNSFDKRALKTISKWSKRWGDDATTAFNVYHECMNVIEDQRIESLWGKIYLGNVHEFVRTRKNLGKELEFVDHPSMTMLAKRFYRDDLVAKTKYPFIADRLKDVEFKELRATMVVLKRIKPYLDEYIENRINKEKQVKELKSKTKEIMSKQAKDLDELRQLDEEKQKTIKQFNDIVEELNNENKRFDEGRQVDSSRGYDVDEDEEEYTDEELGDISYEDTLEELADEARDTVNEIRVALEGNSMPSGKVSVYESPLVKRGQPQKVEYNNKVIRDFKRLLKNFKEKPKQAIVEDGYEVDVGEYITLKANGYGDCFIDDRETNGLSVVISIDGSGSMHRVNSSVVKLVSTLWKSVEDEKSIQIKCITWSSDNKGNMSIRRYNNINDIGYLPYQTSGYTPTHFGIEQGEKELRKMSGKRKLLIVLTDGYPQYKKNGVQIRSDVTCKETIVAYKKAIKTTPNITIIGFGNEIYNSSYMSRMFGNKYIRCRGIQDVENFMVNNLRKEIIRCMKN